MTEECGTYDVFLGGACNPTTWRKDQAIPRLLAKGISFYNPQQDEWHEALIEKEKRAKENSKILLFVFDPSKTRGLASLIEVAFLIKKSQQKLVVVLPLPIDESFHFLEAFTENEKINTIEVFRLVSKLIDLNDGLVFRTLDKALTYIEGQMLKKEPSSPTATIDLANIEKRDAYVVHQNYISIENCKHFEKRWYSLDIESSSFCELSNRQIVNSVFLTALRPYYDMKAQVEAAYILGLGVPTIMYIDESPCSNSPKSPDSGICERSFTDSPLARSDILPTSAVSDYERARAYLLATARDLPHVHLADSYDQAVSMSKKINVA